MLETQHARITPAAGLTLPVVVGVGYLVSYVGLNWISYVESYKGLDITPWNPCTGVSFAFILLAGRRYAPLLLAAPLVADLMLRNLATPFQAGLSTSLYTGSVYLLATHLLQLPRFRFDSELTTLRNVLLLVAAALTSAAVSACGEIALLIANGVLEPADFAPAALRQWIGDLIGIVVVTPFALLLWRRRLGWPDAVGWLQLVTVVATIAIAFSVAHVVPVRLFYLTFLPIIWIALRSGLEGIATGLVVTQLGLVVALLSTSELYGPATAWQLLMAVLAITGLVTGAVVSDQRRAERQIRLLQNARARFDRLGSMGALSAALTHEINQPLSAASTYGRLALDSLATGAGESETARSHIANATAQVQRAAEVVRRMRDFIMLGRSELEAISPQDVVVSAIQLVQPEIERAKVQLTTTISAGLPKVAADAQQIEQVIINLVLNAIEAIQAAGRAAGQIRISAAPAGPNLIEISVQDNGPGFDSEQLSTPITPLATTKAKGLGIGLALCENIVESHGGKLQLANTPGGAVVRFTLREAFDEH